MEENWLPDDSDALDIESLPKPATARKPVSSTLDLTSITETVGESGRAVSVDDAPRYSFGGGSTGEVTDSSSQYRNTKKKSYPKKTFKKKVIRDFDENPLTEDELPRLIKSAEGTVLWHLARRDMTVKQMRDKLKNKGMYTQEIMDAIIQKAIDNNWLNDERYAENFTRSKKEYAKLGKRAIKMELIKKGIDSETANEALQDIDSDDEREQAMELVLKQLPRTQNLEKQKRINRLLGMLARKGYPSDIAYSVIREALDAEIIDEDLTV